MPTINIKIDGKADGKTIAPSNVLVAAGPRVPLTLSVSDVHQQVLAETGKPIPTAINGLGMIDTGASHTCFDQAAAKQAGLPIVGTATMVSASHANHAVPVFAGKIHIPQFGEVQLEAAMGANLAPQHLLALIGRDLLRTAVLVYNGSEGFFSLSL